MSTPFEFTVIDTFLIEGRGLILLPFFPVDRYQCDSKEHVRVETLGGRVFEADADVEIPHMSHRPKVFQATFMIPATQKDDIPVGSKVSLPTRPQNKSLHRMSARRSPRAIRGSVAGRHR